MGFNEVTFDFEWGKWRWKISRDGDRSQHGGQCILQSKTPAGLPEASRSNQIAGAIY